VAAANRDRNRLHFIPFNHDRGKDYLAKIVAETNRRKPDIVLINGDLVDSNVALRPGVLSPLSDFEAPVFFTGGNHENYVDTQRALELIKKHGVRILHNEVVDIHGFYLVGLDYMNPDENTFDMHPSEDKRTIKDVLPTIPLTDDQPSVLMHHSPVGVRYVAAKGIDLMLSGHTHAGQMFPGTLLASVFFPFIKGRYQEGNTKVFVSQGAGTYGPRMRLGSANEINLIRLKVKQ
jgi:predicted MPP superfamily phosphohydrolase